MFLVLCALQTISLTHRDELLSLILVDEELVADQTMVVEAFKDHPSSYCVRFVDEMVTLLQNVTTDLILAMLELELEPRLIMALPVLLWRQFSTLRRTLLPQVLYVMMRYLDSGATHHTTPISESLESKSEYHESSKLLVGNGSALPITHVGQLNISASKPLHLRNILLVPSIKKNLISISQFTLHNDVTVEFDASCCYVKDKQTKTILVQGKLNNGLYQLDVPTSVTMQPAAKESSSSLTSVSHVFTTSASDTTPQVTASSDTALHSCSRNQPNVSLWHNRLGHPHHLVWKQVL